MRYNDLKIFDEWDTAATIFVSADRDVRGAVNLTPRVSIQRVLDPPRPGMGRENMR